MSAQTDDCCGWDVVVGGGCESTGPLDAVALASGLKAAVSRAREELANGGERDICSLAGVGVMAVAVVAMTGSST